MKRLQNTTNANFLVMAVGPDEVVEQVLREGRLPLTETMLKRVRVSMTNKEQAVFVLFKSQLPSCIYGAVEIRSIADQECFEWSVRIGKTVSAVATVEVLSTIRT